MRLALALKRFAVVHAGVGIDEVVATHAGLAAVIANFKTSVHFAVTLRLLHYRVLGF